MAIANSTLSEDKLIFLLGVLDQINDSEIIHLGYFAQPNPEAQAAYRQKHAEILQEDSVEDEPSQPDAPERQTFRVAFVLHLSQVGLLERKMAATWDGPTTETGYEITNLGRVLLVSCPRNKHIFRCDQNGPPARREEGAYLNGYVIDEQRSRGPFSSQPSGPRPVGCFSALLAPHVSVQI